MSDTPRTDALREKLQDELGCGSYEMAMPTCRQLETELNQAIADKKELVEALTIILAALNKEKT